MSHLSPRNGISLEPRFECRLFHLLTMWLLTPHFLTYCLDAIFLMCVWLKMRIYCAEQVVSIQKSYIGISMGWNSPRCCPLTWAWAQSEGSCPYSPGQQLQNCATRHDNRRLPSSFMLQTFKARCCFICKTSPLASVSMTAGLGNGNFLWKKYQCQVL